MNVTQQAQTLGQMEDVTDDAVKMEAFLTYIFYHNIYSYVT